MNVLFINPPAKPGVVYSAENAMYPFSLLFLSSYLKRHGHESKILDLSASPCPSAAMSEYLREAEPNIIGFTGTTENRFLVWDLIVGAKRLSPSATIICGGNHFTYTAAAALRNIHEIDIIVRGEGERTMLELKEELENKDGDLRRVQGISFRDDKGGLVETPDRPEEWDLEKLAIDEAVFEDIVFPGGKYSPFMHLRNFENEMLKALPIQVGRGCPNKCAFCLYHKKKYRQRSAGSVLAEIKAKKEKYGCDVFHLQDPHLLKNQGFVKEFCERIVADDLSIRWYAESRVDINLDLLPLMKKAGCVSMDVAFESASPKVLKAIRKQIDIRQVRALIKKCCKLDIRLLLFSMVSLPEETEADANKTLSFLRKSCGSIHEFAVTPTIIYPGTDLESMAKKKGIIGEDFDWYDRRFENPICDIISSPVPIWMEHLAPNQIRAHIEATNKLRAKDDWLAEFTEVGRELTSARILEYIFNWRGRNSLEHKVKVARNVVRLFAKYSVIKIREACF